MREAFSPDSRLVALKRYPYCLAAFASPPQVVAGKQSIPGFEPVFAPWRTSKRVVASPGFGRRAAGKVLVRADVVIEEVEFAKGAVQRFQ